MPPSADHRAVFGSRYRLGIQSRTRLFSVGRYEYLCWKSLKARPQSGRGEFPHPDPESSFIRAEILRPRPARAAYDSPLWLIRISSAQDSLAPALDPTRQIAP